jgi:5-hydroxyisourate hydrolase
MGRLSTHILDTAHGVPAAGVAIRLYFLGDGRRLIAEHTSNADGRTGAPLLASDRLAVGVYELEFAAGDYFRKLSLTDLPEPAFVDVVVLRFGIADPQGNYHVPLLVSPWAYSTYRGS